MAATAPILRFNGAYGFLSNFWVEPLDHDGTSYASGEHAFQALKTADPQEHEWVRSAPTPGEAKKRGRRITRRFDWDAVRKGYMLAVLRSKFVPGSALAAKLEATGDRLLVEGNTWGDVYWGVCGGQGENWLGQLLMQVRAENRKIAGGPGAGQA